MISVVIVTYNSENVIKDCLLSLQKIKEKEIIIVDNKSRDNTLQEIRKLKLGVTIIKNKKNKGLTAAWNQGAQKAKSETILFLNPDTVLQTRFTKSIEKKLGSSRIGVVGFRFENTNGSLQFSTGRFPTITNVLCDRLPFLSTYYGMQIRDINFYNSKHIVDWVSGSGFAVQKKAFNTVKGFDESIFMYTEDIDFCKRVSQAGYQIVYFPKIIVTHTDTGKNTPQRKPSKYYYMRKGILNYFTKNNMPIQKKIYQTLLSCEGWFLLLVKYQSQYKKLWLKNIKKVHSL